uniref:Golgi transport 1A n=1 Tax=Oryzias sinensis TaxID=183150 RepID=A0A8C8A1K1_9TELE
MATITELQKIGVGLMGFGLFFLLFGVLLYFDSVLLAFGNILFLAGLCFIIGIRRTAHFFFQRNKFRGTLFFLGGVTLVLFRWPVIGMLVESYGFVLLFRSFFPVAIGFVLSVVNLPFLSAVSCVLFLFPSNQVLCMSQAVAIPTVPPQQSIHGVNTATQQCGKGCAWLVSHSTQQVEKQRREFC